MVTLMLLSRNYKYGLLLLQIRNSKYYNYDRNNLKSFLIVQYNTNPKFLKFKSIINALIGNKIDLKSSIYDDQSEASDADMESTLLNSISDEIVYGAGFNKYDNSWHVIPNFDAIINGEKYIENGVTFYNLLQDSLTVCSQYKLLIIFHRILATVQSTRASMKVSFLLIFLPINYSIILVINYYSEW